jgi:hypothetical protein
MLIGGQIVVEFEHSLRQYPPSAPGTPDSYNAAALTTSR